MFAKVTTEVREAIRASEFHAELPYSSGRWLSHDRGPLEYTDDLESVYADDVMHGCLHESRVFVAAAVQFIAEQMLRVTRKYGLLLNFCAGKTEAILSLRGPGANSLRMKIEAVGGILTERFTLRVVCTYKHLGT